MTRREPQTVPLAVEPVPVSGVSVVIPTRNRPESLARVLRSIAEQDEPPLEVIVVDASDDPTPLDSAKDLLDQRLRVVRATAHLCRQRNLGVRTSRGSHVLLCDDDVELPHDYIGRLVDHLRTHPSDGAVTGVLRHHDGHGTFVSDLAPPGPRRLVTAFVFQLSVWGDIESSGNGPLARRVVALLKPWFRRRGNTWSLAGWPLLTQVRSRVAYTAIYSLGAALVRRSWLLASPYDERLGTHGIGDNYGVALAFPACPAIAVLTDVGVLHHRAPQTRLSAEDAHFQRVLALDYFMSRSVRFHRGARLFLLWSLIGSALLAVAHGQFRFAVRTLGVLGRIAAGRNPLVRGPGGPPQPVTDPV